MNTIEERKKRWNAALNNEPDSKNIIIIKYDERISERPLPFPENLSKRIDWSERFYHKLMEQTTWLHDDRIPALNVYTGTETFAEAFGCKVHYPSNDNPFALPLITTAKEAANLKIPNLWDTRITELFEIARTLRNRTDKNAVLKMPDIQSPMDITALIWEKTSLFMALLDEPEAVKELSHKVYILLTQFLDEWFKEFGREFVAHCPDYYMEYGVTLSEDEVGVVSSNVFMESFYDELKELSERYGKIGMHCCANSRHQWANFAKIPNLCLLNLVQPHEIIKEAYPFLKDVCAQMHSSYGEGDIDSWKQQLPKDARIVFCLDAATREDAIFKLTSLREIR